MNQSSSSLQHFPAVLPPRRAAALRHPLVHLGHLLATLATTTWAGALFRGIDLWRQPSAWTAGLPFALALLFILFVHEMGHYLAARRHGVRVSLPYFVPVPFGLGTFGAFIQMDEEPTDRRQLFDIAIWGPLAGLGAAALVLALGGDSLRLAGHLGLLLTAFNLMPVGSLDGGHIARAWFGPRRAEIIGRVTLAAMVAIGLLVWRPMLLWALVAFAFSLMGGERRAEDMTDARVELGPIQHALGIAAAALVPILLVLIVLPSGGMSRSCRWM